MFSVEIIGKDLVVFADGNPIMRAPLNRPQDIAEIKKAFIALNDNSIPDVLKAA